MIWKDDFPKQNQLEWALEVRRVVGRNDQAQKVLKMSPFPQING